MTSSCGAPPSPRAGIVIKRLMPVAEADYTVVTEFDMQLKERAEKIVRQRRQEHKNKPVLPDVDSS